MPFVTRVDYSDNRQVKQFQLTNTFLSGTTTFGLDYSGLTSGVDQATVVTTGFYTGITSTFSGNATTTIFTFGQPEMTVGAETLVPITSSNSGDTQVGLGYEGINPVTIDGNTVYTAYSGVTFGLSVTSISEIAANVWTGTTNSPTVTLLSGASLDYSGRTIWADVKGITRTKRLILSEEPDLDNSVTLVLGRDSQGNVVNVQVGAISGGTDDYVVSGSFNTSTGQVTLTRFSGGTITYDLDGRYLLQSVFNSYTGSTSIGTDDYTTGATFDSNTGIIEFTRQSGGTFSVNISAYSGGTSGGTANTDDYTTGATFNSSTGIIEFTRQSGDTFSVDISAYSGGTSGGTANTDDYTTGATFHSNTGIIEFTRQSGSTFNVDIDGRYLPTSAFTSYTGSTVDNDDYTTGATFNTSDGILEFTRVSGSTFNVDLDGRYLTTSAFTSYTGSTIDNNDYVSGVTFNTSDGILEFTRISGDTFSVDLDGRYLTAYTDTNIFVTGATFNTGNGELTFTNISGGTFNVDLDGRYLTSANFDSYTASTVDNNDYVTGGTFSDSIITLSRISGGTVDINLSALTFNFSGETITAGENLVYGDLVYLDSGGTYSLADNSSENTSSTELRIALESISSGSTGNGLVKGRYTVTGLTTGDKYWVSSGGTITNVTPTTNGSILRYVGTALDSTTLEFNPDESYYELGDLTTPTTQYIRTVTGSTTILSTDYTVKVATSADTTQTLPDATNFAGRIFNIKNADSTSTATVTVATTLSQTIDDLSTTFPIVYPQSLTFQSDGSNWILI